VVLEEQIYLDLTGKDATIYVAMQTLSNKEEEALNEVLTDVIHSEDERGQNLAIERYLKLNMAIAMRNGTLSGEMFNKVADTLKQKKHENVK
jgi:hypothetical protein